MKNFTLPQPDKGVVDVSHTRAKNDLALEKELEKPEHAYICESDLRLIFELRERPTVNEHMVEAHARVKKMFG